jgi:sugar/nucleoside kinase (ribokinase family)
MSVVVVGSMAYDSVETPVEKRENALGGSATYFAAAASFFTDVKLVAVVGEDFDHTEIEFLRQRGVDLEGLTTEPGETFRWKGRYLATMNDRETLYTHLNVFEHFNPILPESYRQVEYVFLANIDPVLQKNVVQQIRKPKFVAMDTMNFWISGALPQLRETLSLVDALVINDSEVTQLSGQDNLFDGARDIQGMGPRTLVIKKGEHGAILIHGDSYFFIPAFPINELRDPTGAGDTFAGGFMGYLALVDDINQEQLSRAMVYATALASFCVEDFSVDRMTSISSDDVMARLERLRAMTHFDIVPIDWRTWPA